MLKKLKQCGKKIEIVVITDGRNGVHAFDGSTVYYLRANKRLKIVETTGAGDAFGSTFVSGLIMRKPISVALKMGSINAEAVISHHGAKNKLLTRKELFSKFKKDKRVVKKIKVS